MPHVALCFWGLCRTTDSTIDSIKENIYTPLTDAKISYDIYVHTFTLNTPYSNPRNAEHNLTLNNELYKLLSPTHVLVEAQNEADKLIRLNSYRTHGDPWANAGSVNYCTFDNHIRAIYSLNKVTQMALKGKYDAFIFLRPDVKFLHPINPAWITSIKEKTILLPDFHMVPLNDRFAIAKPAAAKIYGSRFLDALNYSKTAALHSETYLQHCLDTNRIKIREIKFRFRRIRVPNIEGDTDISVS